MANTQRIDDNSNGNQQIQAGGDVTVSSVKEGGISFGGDNHGIVITSVPTPEEPRHTFDIVKKMRIPTPAALIGGVSSLITIAGFLTGAFSVKQIVDGSTPSVSFDGSGGMLKEHWWLVGSLSMFTLGLIGWWFFRFLRRNVLHLPKRPLFRAWAGIKEENGRTYPYSLRLAMWCPRCAKQKLRFQQVPAETRRVHDPETGAYKKTIVTRWRPMAVCTRNDEHSIPVDISGNDFDEALPR